MPKFTICKFGVLIKTMKHFSIFFIFLTSVCNVFAQTAPKYSNEFLNIGVGARGLGMANAQTAVVNDVTAGYWNPAGLLGIKEKYQGSLMHAEYFAGIAQYDYIGFATAIDSNSHLGISAIRFGVDDIPDTRFLYDANGILNYDNVKFFSAADYAFLLSYARRMPWLKGLRVGANFKIIYRNVGSFANAWGFGLDVGGQYSLKGWQVGVMLKDITGTYTTWNHNVALVYDTYIKTGNDIPKSYVEVTLPKMNLGVAKRFPIKKNFGLLTALDFNTTFDGARNVLIKSNIISLDPGMGLEADYRQRVFLRAGVNNVQQIKNFDSTKYSVFQLNFGLGIKLGNFFIDYALTDMGNQAQGLYSNVFSIKAAF